jgi:hypothetical protein
LLVAIFAALPWVSVAGSSTPEYSIQAIRYGSADDHVASLAMGAPEGEQIMRQARFHVRPAG